jgi:ATP-dependent DNA ligase
MPVREALPRFLPPMLARSEPLPDRRDARWVSEVKWDGIRAQLRIDRGSLTLRTRPGRNATREFPELAALSEALRAHRVLLDGELVCLDNEGRPDFAAVIALIAGGHRSAGRPALLQLFDVLHLDGEPVRALAYQQRRSTPEDRLIRTACILRPSGRRHALPAREQQLASGSGAAPHPCCGDTYPALRCHGGVRIAPSTT